MPKDGWRGRQGVTKRRTEGIGREVRGDKCER